jgi:hypothetical protein
MNESPSGKIWQSCLTSEVLPEHVGPPTAIRMVLVRGVDIVGSVTSGDGMIVYCYTTESLKF